MAELSVQKATPGPWKHSSSVGANLQSCSQSSAVLSADCKQVICGCFADITGGEVSAQANARLIAAAPDLLFMLKDAQLQIQYLHEKFSITGSGIACLAKIEAVIRKAEGR